MFWFDCRKKKKTAMFFDKKLILHRYHGENQSKKMTNIGRLKFRIKLWKNVCCLLKNKRKEKIVISPQNGVEELVYVRK